VQDIRVRRAKGIKYYYQLCIASGRTYTRAYARVHLYSSRRKLGGWCARGGFWCSVMNLYEALEGLRCPGARLCRCLNRNSGLLRSCGTAVRARRRHPRASTRDEVRKRNDTRQGRKTEGACKRDRDDAVKREDCGIINRPCDRADARRSGCAFRGKKGAEGISRSSRNNI